MEEMRNCKACGKEIEKGVKKCSYCGKNQRSFFIRHKITSVILALVIICGILGVIGSQVNSTPVEVITVSAVDLAKAYEANEVSADKAYKEKTVLTNGKVEYISVVAGQTHITLSSGVESSLRSVQCFFKEQSEIDKVGKLKEGATVTVQGVVEGKSINVIVNDCVLK